MHNHPRLTTVQRILLILAGLSIFATLALPIWRIELDAAQYPEGLELLIYSDRIAGQVDIINGLNHYIGMKTLHTDDFVEFKILPYLLALYALAFIFTALVGKYRALRLLFVAYILFGIVSMVDFWLWEYNYGHNLDPSAPIKVPGMAYQPPLIGFKQLLNFGAFSAPAIGGWLLVGAGVILTYCRFTQYTKRNKP